MDKIKLTGKAHRFAEFWPIDSAVVEEMAEDIKANGQRVPIVVMEDGTIIDGRTRYMACKKAGVEPQFVVDANNDDEIIASTIKSLNRNRRHTSASVCACIDALVAEELGERRGRPSKTLCNHNNSKSDQKTQIQSQAHRLLVEAPDLFALAKAGQGSVGEHYKTLKERRAESEKVAYQMDELLRYDPELHRKVETGGTTIQEAVAEMEKRKAAEGQEVRERREAIERETGRLGDVVGVWSTIKGKRLEELSQLIAFDQSGRLLRCEGALV
jgi:hypothetical protein